MVGQTVPAAFFLLQLFDLWLVRMMLLQRQDRWYAAAQPEQPGWLLFRINQWYELVLPEQVNWHSPLQ